MDTSIAFVVRLRVEHNFYISAVNKLTLMKSMFHLEMVVSSVQTIYETNYGVK
jgi:hypothetical protein